MENDLTAPSSCQRGEKTMSDCEWEAIEAFVSPSEFRRFNSWLQNQLACGMVEEVPVLDSYAGPYFEERWFACKASGEVWRLVAPQDPFHGYWGPIKLN